MLNLDTLNSEQLEAVQTVNGPVMLLAGAGTGKTRVITYRIAHMIDSGVSPEGIVAVTFTNKAAREMSDRVADLVGARANRVHVSTFHSFCLRFLRSFYKQAGLNSRFHLVGTSEQIDLVRRSLEEKGATGFYRPELVHSQISWAKNQLFSPTDILKPKNNLPTAIYEPETIAEFYSLYERQLKLNDVIDFDDCIFKAVDLLRNNPEVRQDIKEKYTHILVDEFQDTNYAQLCLIEELASSHNNICVVGCFLVSKYL